MALIGAMIGGVAVIAILVLSVALMWMTRMKHKSRAAHLHQQEKEEGRVQRHNAQHSQETESDDEAMEMKSNDAYKSTTQQIPIEVNVAYGQIESNNPLFSDQCDEREVVQHRHHQQQQGDEIEGTELKCNAAYISLSTHQIPTADNVAYGQIESDHSLLSDQCEYDYI